MPRAARAKASSRSRSPRSINRVDTFSNIFYQEVVESAANTLTFKEINFNMTTFETTAIVLARLEYYFAVAQLCKINADEDAFEFGISTDNTFTTPELAKAQIIDIGQIQAQAFGTPANAVVYQAPIIRDFAGLPGGGRIVYPKPLYVWFKGTNIASAVTMEVRGFFTYINISGTEAWELLQTARLTS